MSAYIIADITLFAPEKMSEYATLAHQAMTEHGAELLVLGDEIEPLEGDWLPRRMVVLRFEDRDAARRFYGSDTYVRAKASRKGIASFRAVVVDGFAASAQVSPGNRPESRPRKSEHQPESVTSPSADTAESVI